MRRVQCFLCFLPLLLLLAAPAPAAQPTLKVSYEQLPLKGRTASFTIQLKEETGQPYAHKPVTLRPHGTWTNPEGEAIISRGLRTDVRGMAAVENVRIDGGDFIVALTDGSQVSGNVHHIPGFWTLLPPLLAIAIALWLRQVLLALALGVFGGAWLFYGGIGAAYLEGLRKILIPSVTDSFQASILVFTAALGGVVGVMAAAGGTHGMVDRASRLIKDARGSQLATAVLGLAIFFDDYANTLLVGNTMRPVTDRMRVSREKLSYLVDSTAAPVATIAVLSTWVGYQVGLIGDGLESVGQVKSGAYALFLESILYSTYSWFALILLFWLVFRKRDFGPMLAAERRARATGAVLAEGARPLADDIGEDLQPAEGAPRRAHLAIIPVLTILLGTVIGLWVDGGAAIFNSEGSLGRDAAGLREILSAADPAAALLWAAMAGTIVAIGLAVGERILKLGVAVEAWISGAKAMLPALIILVLAWSIGSVCEMLGTAGVVVDAATGNLAPWLLPTVVFLIAGFLGFSTGSSWGTMAILMPIAFPLADALPRAAGVGEEQAAAIMLSCVASVLSGSVLGDHCSPISDTTIMSSMASGADHVDHVRTQMPYALVAGAMAIVLGTLPAGFGISPLITLPLGLVALGVIVHFVGQSSEA